VIRKGKIVSERDQIDPEEQELIDKAALDFVLDGRLILKDRALKN
jgi:hypothetical protein